MLLLAFTLGETSNVALVEGTNSTTKLLVGYTIGNGSYGNVQIKGRGPAKEGKLYWLLAKELLLMSLGVIQRYI